METEGLVVNFHVHVIFFLKIATNHARLFSLGVHRIVDFAIRPVTG